MSETCNIINYNIQQLLQVETIRQFGALSYDLESCLVNLRLNNNQFEPWNNIDDAHYYISRSMAFLCLPLILWYIIIYMLQSLQSYCQHQQYITHYNSNINLPDKIEKETTKIQNLIFKTIDNTIKTRRIESLDVITTFIWVFSGLISFIILNYSNFISKTKYIFVYGNRVLTLLSFAQLIFIIQGITLCYSHIKFYHYHMRYEQTVKKIDIKQSGLSYEKSDALTEDLKILTENKFPTTRDIQMTMIEYIIINYNLLVLVSLLIGWICIFNKDLVIYYTSIASVTCLLFSLCTWFWVWYPLNGINWYQNRYIWLTGSLWVIVLLLTSIPLLITNQDNNAFYFTNDTYQNWWIAIPIGVLIELLIMVYLLLAIFSFSNIQQSSNHKSTKQDIEDVRETELSIIVKPEFGVKNKRVSNNTRKITIQKKNKNKKKKKVEIAEQQSLLLV